MTRRADRHAPQGRGRLITTTLPARTVLIPEVLPAERRAARVAWLRGGEVADDAGWHVPPGTGPVAFATPVGYEPAATFSVGSVVDIYG